MSAVVIVGVQPLRERSSSFGAILTGVGAVMYVLPVARVLPVALGALVMAAAAAVWMFARHH
ncbi:hypothetical protein [Streptomyces sp. NPDC090036]|uniref:hypothetical protein n=1 Tax=Streptomyces sp. NPDC090036 TaxID=3365926 RepID=UPI00381A2D59